MWTAIALVAGVLTMTACRPHAVRTLVVDVGEGDDEDGTAERTWLTTLYAASWAVWATIAAHLATLLVAGDQWLEDGAGTAGSVPAAIAVGTTVWCAWLLFRVARAEAEGWDEDDEITLEDRIDMIAPTVPETGEPMWNELKLKERVAIDSARTVVWNVRRAGIVLGAATGAAAGTAAATPGVASTATGVLAGIATAWSIAALAYIEKRATANHAETVREVLEEAEGQRAKRQRKKRCGKKRPRVRPRKDRQE